MRVRHAHLLELNEYCFTTTPQHASLQPVPVKRRRSRSVHRSFPKGALVVKFRNFDAVSKFVGEVTPQFARRTVVARVLLGLTSPPQLTP